MNAGELIPGDQLLRWKDGVWHRGIYVGNGLVLDNAPRPNGGESIRPFADFAMGERVYAQQPPWQNRAEIVQRARQIIAHPKNYSYLWRNCEHTFYEIVEGRPRSPTVAKFIALAVLVAAGVLAVKYNKEITQALKKLGR